MSVPNQRKIQIGPRSPRDSQHLYAMMNLDALKTAMHTLNGSGLKLWLYFNKNQNDYSFELSQKACEDWGIKKDSYYKAITELKDKRYLIPIQEGSNIYTFYEDPRKNPKFAETDSLENQKIYSDFQNCNSDYQTSMSQNQQRNNTNNTLKVQDKTQRKNGKSQEERFREIGF